MEGVIYTLEEYNTLFNAFESVCTALEAVNRLYIWPFLERMEDNPDVCSKEAVTRLLKEMDKFIRKQNLSYEEFCSVLKLGGVTKLDERDSEDIQA